MNYHVIENRILQKYSRFITSFDPILNQVGVVKTIHQGGFLYYDDNYEYINPMNKLILTIEMSQSIILDYNLELFTQKLFDMARQFIDDLSRTMFSTLNTLSEQTGNVFNAQKQNISFDMILNILEKISIRFNENLEPILPSIIAGPELSELLMKIKITPDQEEKQKIILEKKKEEFYAKKTYRRLSYKY
jgi:hypothetical protein